MSSFVSTPLDRPVGYLKDDRLQEAELAYIDSCQKRVAEWADAAQFSPELVLERLTEECQRGSEHVFEGLRSTFTRATANSSENLDEAAFTTLITQKIDLPSHILQRAGPILFGILAYASTLPFPSQKPPAHLNLDSLIRGVAILTPSLNPLNRGDESSNYVVSRRRTKQDACRIIFQSIASPGPHTEETPETGDTTEREDSEKLFFIDVSAEDVRTTDLLDALVVSQPDQSPYMSNIARCFFKDIASTSLKGQAPQRSQMPHSLRVSKEKFQAVLQLVAVLEATESGNVPVVVGEIERSAGRLIEEVFVDPEAESVGWSEFEDGVNKTMPKLAKELGGLLGTIFNMGEDAAA